jgi:hypothetical protein
MSKMTSETLRELAGWGEGPCVSLYLSLDPKHPDVDADRVALKNLVRAARRELEATSTRRRPEIDELLTPAERLLAAERWPLGSRGYGIFAAPGHVVETDVDTGVPSLAVVADRFVVTPLVGALRRADRFYVLALSQNRVRLFRAVGGGLVDVVVPGLPVSRQAALWYEHHERLLNVHGGGHFGVDTLTGTRHGSASAHDLHKEQLTRFFRAVDDRLSVVLRHERAPVFVAGIGSELAAYREANRHPYLAGVVDTGSPERLTPAELYERVLPAAAEVLDAPRREVLERINASSLPLDSIAAILQACGEGRVAAVVARPDRLVWGRLDPLEVHAERDPSDVELVSVTIAAALDQGAAVYPAAPGELRGDAPIAAVPRFRSFRRQS